MNNSQNKDEAATLRRRLQTCEKRIIELVDWDAEYFYDESLSYEELDQLKALLKKRQRILNKMCVFTDNEIKRLEVLNAMFIDAIRQMNQDLSNLHNGRMNMVSSTLFPTPRNQVLRFLSSSCRGDSSHSLFLA